MLAGSDCRRSVCVGHWLDTAIPGSPLSQRHFGRLDGLDSLGSWGQSAHQAEGSPPRVATCARSSCLINSIYRLDKKECLLLSIEPPRVRATVKREVDVKQDVRLRHLPIKASRKKALQAQTRVWVRQLAPGLSLTSGLALLATFVHTLPIIGIFSPLILAILLGIVVRNTVGTAPIFQLGISFSLKRILKFAIILLGLQLSLTQVIAVGPIGLAIVAVTASSTFYFTCWFGKRLGVSKKLSQLIAAGTSICGASAVIATNVVVDSSDEDVAYAVAMVTVFGTASMLLYPVLPALLHLTPQAFGIWCGASIHEVAQVIAAAFQDGPVTGQIATISKLSRVMLLAPMVLTLGVLSVRSEAAGQKMDLRKLPIPWFV